MAYRRHGILWIQLGGLSQAKVSTFQDGSQGRADVSINAESHQMQLDSTVHQ